MKLSSLLAVSLIFQIVMIAVSGSFKILSISLFFNWLIIIILTDKKYVNYVVMLGILAVSLILGMHIANYSLLIDVLKNLHTPSISIVQIFYFLFGWCLLILSGYLISKFLVKNTGLIMRILYSFSFGAGINSLIMIILGHIGYLKPAHILSVYLVVITAGLFFNRRNLKFKIRHTVKIRNEHLLLAIISSPFILFSFYNSLSYPVFYLDSLAYGIEWTKIIYDNGFIPLIAGGPSISLHTSSNYPPAYQLMGVFFSVLTGFNDTLLKLISPIIFLFTILLMYKISVECFKNTTSSLIATSIFLMFPLTILFSRFYTFYIYLLFQFSFSLFLLYLFYRNKTVNLLLISAMIGGFAALSSYLGLLYVPFFLFFHIRHGLRFDKPFVFAFLVFVMTISLWYARNLILLGNPIWPMGGGKFIDSGIQLANMEHFKIMSELIGFGYHDIYSFLSALYNFLFNYVDYFNTTFDNGLRPFIALFAIPSVAYYLRNKKANLSFFISWFILVLLAYILLINQFERYTILYVVPVAIISTHLINYLSKFKILKIMVISLLGLLYLNAVIFSSYWNECHGLNEDNIGAYITNKSGALDLCYPYDSQMWKWITDNLPHSSKIATYEIRWYYANATFVPLDSWEFRNIYQTNDIEDALQILKSSNVTHILISGWTSPDSMIMPSIYKNNIIYSSLNSDKFEITKFFGPTVLYRVIYE